MKDGIKEKKTCNNSKKSMKKEILKYNLQRGIKDAGLWSQTNQFLILTPSCNTLWDLGHVSPSLYALFFSSAK